MVQLKKLDKNNQKRRRITEEYKRQLKDIPWISVPFNNSEGKPSYHIFPILLSEDISRKEFMDKLKQEGIQTSIHYPPIHLFSIYRRMFGLKEGVLPKTEFVGEHEVTLPLHPLMNTEEVSYLMRVLKVAK